MMRLQVQLPDELYRDAKRIAQEREIPLAEMVRRGLEQMCCLNPARGEAWQIPEAVSMGQFNVSVEGWRELAQMGRHPQSDA